MSANAHHSRLSPRAFVDLAHEVADGRPVAEAARIAGLEPQMVERLVQHWAFMLLLRIIPFFKLAPRNPSAARPIASGQRPSARPAPPRRAFSLWRRRQAQQAAPGSADEAMASEMHAAMTGALQALAAMAETARFPVPGHSARPVTIAATPAPAASYRASAGAFLSFREKTA
ncbi:MAG: hypothetical protein R3C97_06905 [Geminicoccaceae bacterium]